MPRKCSKMFKEVNIGRNKTHWSADGLHNNNNRTLCAHCCCCCLQRPK